MYSRLYTCPRPLAPRLASCSCASATPGRWGRPWVLCQAACLPTQIILHIQYLSFSLLLSLPVLLTYTITTCLTHKYYSYLSYSLLLLLPVPVFLTSILFLPVLLTYTITTCLTHLYYSYLSYSLLLFLPVFLPSTITTCLSHFYYYYLSFSLLLFLPVLLTSTGRFHIRVYFTLSIGEKDDLPSSRRVLAFVVCSARILWEWQQMLVIFSFYHHNSKLEEETEWQKRYVLYT